MSSQKSASLDTIGISRLVMPQGTKESYKKKRAAKALTKAAMRRLFGLQSPINDDYRQAYMCNEYLFQKGKKITSNYCSKRCCTVCNRIRAAQNLSKYADRILALPDLYLVTLTDKNVSKGELSENVGIMYKALTRIKKNLYAKKMKINGYRSFECTYGYKSGFNPHFHFIVQGKDVADMLVHLWLKQMPNASIKGQNITKVRHSKKSLLELFKYIAKPITKGYYSASAYDEIMRAIKHHRVSDSLGCIRGKNLDRDSDDLDKLQAQEIDFKGHRFTIWRYVQELFDYVSPEGELLIDEAIDLKTLNAINVIHKSESETREKRFDKIGAEQIMQRQRQRIKSEGVIF